jgi:hypothetical protein
MKKLNMKQYNSLITGNMLYAKLTPTLPDHLSCVTVQAYIPSFPYDRRKIPKTLNRSIDDLRFRIEKYEMSIASTQSWQSKEESYKNYSWKDNISSIEELERELEAFLPDLSLLSGGSDPTPRPEDNR